MYARSKKPKIYECVLKLEAIILIFLTLRKHVHLSLYLICIQTLAVVLAFLGSV